MGTPQSLKLVPVPMMLLEPSVSVAMGFGSSRRLTGQTGGLVVQESHPLAGGNTGAVTLCSGTAPLQAIQVPAASNVIELSTQDGSLVFFFEADDVVGEELRAPRVGLSILKPAACQTDASWALFDAAYAWLLN